MDQLFKKRNLELKEFAHYLKRKKTKRKKEIPDHLFEQCPHCHYSIPSFSLKENHYICPQCGFHLKISAQQRIEQIIDQGTWKELFSHLKTGKQTFPGYNEKLLQAKEASGLDEAVVCGVGKINDIKAVCCIMDSHFMMGSMGKTVGEKITRSIEYASRKHLPLIISATSGGARMQEGIDSLMQMAKINMALKKFSQEGFYISLLTHPTMGGVSASFAFVGDIIIAEPQALIGFAGQRVIKNTIKQELPKGFQTSEFLLEKGFIDMIVERNELKETLGILLKMHGGKK